MHSGTEGATPPASMPGIHHVTAIAGDPQTNLAFYAGVLGLRLVKRTVNFDDPGTYHLYYGDGEGSPGSILTFFPWPGARRGTPGAGQVSATAFAVPEASLGWWHERLRSRQVAAEPVASRDEGDVLRFLDPDGMRLELVTSAGAVDRRPWGQGPIPERHALRGFAGVTLAEGDPRSTLAHLDTLGFAAGGEDGARRRLWVGEGADRAFVDVVPVPGGAQGRIAAGSVHHIAFRARDDAHQQRWRDVVADHVPSVTPMVDRRYFHSIYWREPGGVLFELATDPPGFTLDEPVSELGSALRLPSWLEPERSAIEAHLPPLDLEAALRAGSGDP